MTRTKDPNKTNANRQRRYREKLKGQKAEENTIEDREQETIQALTINGAHPPPNLLSPNLPALLPPPRYPLRSASRTPQVNIRELQGPQVTKGDHIAGGTLQDLQSSGGESLNKQLQVFPCRIDTATPPVKPANPSAPLPLDLQRLHLTDPPPDNTGPLQLPLNDTAPDELDPSPTPLDDTLLDGPDPSEPLRSPSILNTSDIQSSPLVDHSRLRREIPPTRQPSTRLLLRRSQSLFDISSQPVTVRTTPSRLRALYRVPQLPQSPSQRSSTSPDTTPAAVTLACSTLQQSWGPDCNCKQPTPLPTDGAASLPEITGFWKLIWPMDEKQNPLASISHHYTLPRSGSHNDFHSINWKGLLSSETGEAIPINLIETEANFKKRSQPPAVRPDTPETEIHRTWDIDSFLARISTLAAYRGSFKLSFYPPFLAAVTQDPRVTFNGVHIQKCAQLRLGGSAVSGGYNYRCHVLFPNLALLPGGTVHLSDEQQAIWIDEIVLPALRQTCPSHILQHHPRSFQEVVTKARSLGEKHIHGAHQPIDANYRIPEAYLEAFWCDIRLRAAIKDGFRDPILVVSSHDLKLDFRRPTAYQTRGAFSDHLKHCFNFNEQTFPPDDCWLDFGIEDSPQGGCEGCTLLRKSSCLRQWAEFFECPKGQQSYTIVKNFPWNGTRDAGGISVELKPSNTLRSEGAISYNKAYNLSKDLFTTPVKGLQPFGHQQLEALGFSQAHIDAWYTENIRAQEYRRGSTGRKITRLDLIKTYLCSKERLHQSLTAARQNQANGQAGVHFGVRQEFRLRYSRLMELELSNTPSATIAPFALPSYERSSSVSIAASSDTTREAPSSRHLPYWVLPTLEVVDYLYWSIQRWTLLLEVLISRTVPGPTLLLPISRAQEVLNGAMVSAVLRTLRLQCGGTDPSAHWHNALMRDTWTPHIRAARRTRDLPPRRGLNYTQCIQRAGMIWLPHAIVNWAPYPSIDPTVLRRMPLRHNQFAQTFRNFSRTTKGVVRENEVNEELESRIRHLFVLFTEGTNRYLEDVFAEAEQLVICQLVKDILQLLLSRVEALDCERRRDESLKAFKRRKDRATQERRTLVKGRWTLQERAGYSGLTFEMVERLIEANPRVSFAKAPTTSGTARNGTAGLSRYYTATWKSRFRALFRFDDGIHRAWEQKPFRCLTRQVCTLLQRTVGDHSQEAFLDSLSDTASLAIWILPCFDKEHLSTIQTAKPNHSIDTKRALQRQPLLEGTNWMLPRMPEHYDNLIRICSDPDHRDYDLAREQLEDTWEDSLPWETLRQGAVNAIHLQGVPLGALSTPYRIWMQLASSFDTRVDTRVARLEADGPADDEATDDGSDPFEAGSQEGAEPDDWSL